MHSSPGPPLLEVRDLTVQFPSVSGLVRPVDAVNLRIERGETLGLVGESGCGKSTLAEALLGLVSPPGRAVGGEVLWKGRDLLDLPEKLTRRVRGNEIGFVFQEPTSAMNPVRTVGDHVSEPLRVHDGLSRRQARERALELLNAVHLPDPRARLDQYPHQLSGGMKQRVLIAMAIACSPELLIADEPTSALDATVQAQILALLESLKERYRLALLLISHDLGAVTQSADRVAVMYAGRIVEEAPVDLLFDSPKHPYTIGLLRSIPDGSSPGAKRRLEAIPGTVPDLAYLPAGCAFAPRCPERFEACERAVPELTRIGDDRWSACYLHAPAMKKVENAMGGVAPTSPAS